MVNDADGGGTRWVGEGDEQVGGYHDRGGDELVHRAFKDFGFEEMPFNRFSQNAAFYYTMLVAFFLYESFKKNGCSGMVEVSSYATTVRRNVVRHGKKVILKVTEATWKALDIGKLGNGATRRHDTTGLKSRFKAINPETGGAVRPKSADNAP